ncbi:hypothetical protein BC830DRAFT_1150987 [Chytriomyces sp. MP71]|nr:hypothetical protein BC830DRAFT_1150987 [Chytriomyces sp. MP71]
MSWANADETCGLPCQEDMSCPTGLKCFRDLRSCINNSSNVTTSFFSGSHSLRDDTLVFSKVIPLDQRDTTTPSLSNATQNGTLVVPSRLNSLTISQIDATSGWFWVPTILTYIFSLVLYLFLYRLCRLYIHHRRIYFRTPEFLESLAHRSLLLTYIPDIETSKELIKFLRERDSGLTIVDAVINRNVTELGKLVKEHDEKTKELERYLVRMFEKQDEEKAVKVFCADTIGRAGKIDYDAFMKGGSVSGQSQDDEEVPGPSLKMFQDSGENNEEENSEAHKAQENKAEGTSQMAQMIRKLKKQFRFKSATEDERRTEITRLSTEISQLEEKIEAIRAVPEHEHPSNESGFLAVGSPQDAHRVIKTIRSHPKYLKMFGGIHMKFAPEFPDIIWVNIGRKPAEIYARRFLALFLTIGVIITWIIVSGLLTSVQNLSTLFQNNQSVLNWLTAHQVWQNILQNIMCPLPLAIFNFFLPIMIRLITQLQGVKSGAGCDRSVMYKTYIFNMAQIFLFAVVSQVIQNQVPVNLPDAVITDYTVLEIVAAIQSLSQNSYFYITLLASFYLGFGLEVLQGVTLGVSYFRRLFFKFTPRDEYELNGPNNIDYVDSYANLIMAFTVSLTFSIIAPFIIPFAMLFFGIAFVIMKYQLMYVYEVDNETNGAFFPKLFNILTCSVGFFQLITFLAVLAGNLSANYSGTPPTGLREWMVLAPLPFVTLGLWIAARLILIPRGQYCVLDLLKFKEEDTQNGHDEKAPSRTFTSKLNLVESVFNPEFVKPLTRVMVAPKYMERLSQYYTPRRRIVDIKDPRTRAWALSLPSLKTLKRRIARTAVLTGNQLTYSELQQLDLADLQARGLVPPEDIEAVDIQLKVAEEERRREMGLTDDESRRPDGDIDGGGTEVVDIGQAPRGFDLSWPAITLVTNQPEALSTAEPAQTSESQQFPHIDAEPYPSVENDLEQLPIESPEERQPDTFEIVFIKSSSSQNASDGRTAAFGQDANPNPDQANHVDQASNQLKEFFATPEREIMPKIEVVDRSNQVSHTALSPDATETDALHASLETNSLDANMIEDRVMGREAAESLPGLEVPLTNQILAPLISVDDSVDFSSSLKKTTAVEQAELPTDVAPEVTEFSVEQAELIVGVASEETEFADEWSRAPSLDHETASESQIEANGEAGVAATSVQPDEKQSPPSIEISQEAPPVEAQHPFSDDEIVFIRHEGSDAIRASPAQPTSQPEPPVQYPDDEIVFIKSSRK